MLEDCWAKEFEDLQRTIPDTPLLYMLSKHSAYK